MGSEDESDFDWTKICRYIGGRGKDAIYTKLIGENIDDK